MHIAQITDIHVGANGKYAAGTNVIRNYERVRDWLQNARPDVVVCTGDIICDRETTAEARTILTELGSTCDALYVIPGNHDDPATLTQLCVDLGLTGSWPFRVDVEGVPMLFLDTADGTLGEAGRSIIMETDRSTPGNTPIITFSHHPLATSGCTELDRAVALADLSESEAALERIQHPFHAFCGHFHSEGSVRIGSGWVHRTGAVSFAVPCDSAEFRVDHTRPCFRTIALTGGSVTTESIELDEPAV